MAKHRFKLEGLILCICLATVLCASDTVLDHTKTASRMFTVKATSHTDKRLLQTIDPKNPLTKRKLFGTARRHYIMVVPNIAEVINPTSASISYPTGAMANGKAVMKSVDAMDIDLGNTMDWLVLTLPESTTIPGVPVTVSLQSNDTGAVELDMITSDNNVYLYSYSSKDGMQTLGIVLAIVLAAFSCGCCLVGVKQFYHLIRLAQLFYMLALINSPAKAASIFAVLSGFWLNLFSVVPNPLKIDEFNGVQCQPAVDFFGEMLSCHVYNSLRNYVLGFIIFSIIAGFVHHNKFTDHVFFHNLTRSIRLRMFFWTILPDVMIAVWINVLAPVANSVLSLGALACFLLLVGYTLMFSSTIQDFFTDKYEAIAFLEHFSFSRSNLTVNDSRLGIKLTAVFLDQLKVMVLVTMIALFNNSPMTQMAIVFIAYFINAVFLVVVRPWNGFLQNGLYALTEICFFLLVLLMFIAENNSDTLVIETRESRMGNGQIALFFIIYFINLIIYLVPVLKGEDLRATVMQEKKEHVDTDDEDGKDKKASSVGNIGRTDRDLVQPASPETAKLQNNESAVKVKAMGRDIPTADGPRKHQSEGESSQNLKKDNENTSSKPKVFEPPKQPHTYGRPGDNNMSQMETQGLSLPPLGEIQGKKHVRAGDQLDLHKSLETHGAALQNSANPSVSDLGGSQLPAIGGPRSGKQQVRKTFKPLPQTKNDDQI
jgi:hypothetical protein